MQDTGSMGTTYTLMRVNLKIERRKIQVLRLSPTHFDRWQMDIFLCHFSSNPVVIITTISGDNFDGNFILIFIMMPYHTHALTKKKQFLNLFVSLRSALLMHMARK